MTGPKLTGGRCECQACGLRFTSVREFDRHRAGGYAPPGEWQGDRHCRSLADLLARGWRMDDRGFLLQGRRERAPVRVEGDKAEGAATTVAGAP